jgi:hypothetical protein
MTMQAQTVTETLPTCGSGRKHLGCPCDACSIPRGVVDFTLWVNIMLEKPSSFTWPAGVFMNVRAGMKTPANVDMSPRMARFQMWCEFHKLGLTTFSTDTCVAARMTQLTTLRAQLVTQIGALQAGSVAATVSGQVLQSLDALMARTPANRSQGVQQPALLGSQAQTEVVNSNELIAVAMPSELTGAIAYWELSGDVEYAQLSTQAAALLPSNMHPARTSDEVAFTLAVKELAARNVLLRKDPKGGWALVVEYSEAGKLKYNVRGRFILQNGEVKLVDIAEGADLIKLDNTLAHVRGQYEHNKLHMNANAISVWLVKTIGVRLGGVPLRDRGGVYFVPRGQIETFHKVKEVLGACSSHTLHEIPAMRSGDTIKAILAAVSGEVTQWIKDAEDEMSKGIGQRAARNRAEEGRELVKKVKSYETLLGQPLQGALDRLNTACKALDKATTRFAQLEVD